MADEVAPLTDEERAELEALRAEKAARIQAEQAARERAELEALRNESARAVRPSNQAPAQQRTTTRRAADPEDERIREARERGAKLMEPGDDLRMPMGQKIVLGVLALLVVIILFMTHIVG